MPDSCVVYAAAHKMGGKAMTHQFRIKKYWPIIAYFSLLLTIFIKCMLSTTFIQMSSRAYNGAAFSSARLYLSLSRPALFQPDVLEFNLGQSYYFDKKYDAATAHYAKALGYISDNDKEKQCLVRIQLANSVLRPFEKEFDQGKINDHKAQVDRAISLLEGCLKLDSNNIVAVKNLALLKQAQQSKSNKNQQQQQPSGDSQPSNEEQQATNNDDQAKKQQREFNDQDSKKPTYDFSGPNW